MVTSAISRMGRSPEEGIKAPVKTSTTANITLAGTGQTLNGVVTSTGDRVLVKDQTVPAENGTYLVGPDDWERTTDMNAADDLANGQLIVDSNTLVTYVITYTGAWTPDITALVFTVLLGSMPSMITLTNPNPIDLVDIDVALITGADDPATEPHLEYDFQSVQSKSDATTAAPLFLNPLGGNVEIGQQTGADDANVRIWHNGHHSWDFLEALNQVYSYQAFDNTASDPMELLIEFYDEPSGNLWGQIGWNGEDTFKIVARGYDSDFSLEVLNGSGFQVQAVVFNSASFAVQLDVAGSEESMFEASAGATVALSQLDVYVPTTFDFDVTVANLLTIQGVSPEHRFLETGVGADQGNWRWVANGESFDAEILDDALANAYAWLSIDRSGTGAGVQVDNVSIASEIAISLFAPDIAVSGTVDGRDVDGDGTAQDTHIADATIHFTQASISIPASQVSDFDTEVSNNASVTANTAKVTNVPTALSIGTHAIGTFGITSDGSADDVVIPSFTATLSGVIPGSGGGTTNFMRADGTWAVPPGGAALPAGADTEMQYNNGGAFGGIPQFTFADGATTGAQFSFTPLAGLTSGDLISIFSSITGKTGAVVNIGQGQPTSTAITLNVSSNSSTGRAIEATHSQASGVVARFVSAIATRTVPVVEIINDSNTGSGVALEIQNDQAGAHIDLTGTNGEGIKFPATQNASTDLNTLDDYEEYNNNNANIQDASLSDGEGQATTSNVDAVKIGRLVSWSAWISVTDLGTLNTGDAVRIDLKLPWDSEQETAISVGYAISMNITAGDVIVGTLQGGTSLIELNLFDATTGTSPMSIAEFSVGGQIRIAGTYQVAS